MKNALCLSHSFSARFQTLVIAVQNGISFWFWSHCSQLAPVGKSLSYLLKN